MKEGQVLQLYCPLIGLLLVMPFRGSGSDTSTTAIHTKGNCTCVTSDGAEYNLMPLRRTDGVPRFNVRGVRYKSWNYTYNPCVPVTLPKFSRRTTCHDAALCRMDPNSLVYEGIGRQQGARCTKAEDGVIELVYEIVDRLIAAKTSRVVFICDQKRATVEDAEFKPQEEDTFTFAVIHRCACPNGCTSTTTTPAPTKTSPPVSTSSSVIPPTGTKPSGQNSGKYFWEVVTISLISIVCVIAAVIWCFCCLRPCRNCCHGNPDEVAPILGQGEAGNGREGNEDRLGGQDAVEREGRAEGEGNAPAERIKFPVQVSEEEDEAGSSV